MWGSLYRLVSSLEQLITGESHYTVDDDMLPTMPAQLVAMRQGINNYSSVIVVAVLLLSMGSFALTQDFYTYCNLVIGTMPMFLGAYLSGTYDGIPCG